MGALVFIVQVVGSFSKKEAIKFGWGVMKSHFWFFVAALVVASLVSVIPNIFNSLSETNKNLTIPVIVVAWVALAIKLVMDLGFIKIALQLHDNQPVQLSMLFSQYRLLVKYLLSAIVYGLIILGGFILLIIPGIIFSIRFQYYSYLMVDKSLGPIEALKQSWRMTKGHTWNLFLLGILLGLINLGGALLLLVGLLATIPTTMMANAYVFRKLQAASASTPGTPAPASA